MNDLVNLDPTFTESGFKTKVDNIFVMLHMSFMTDNMKRVEHFLSKGVFDEFSNKLNIFNSNNERQMYDELNVKSTDIIDVEVTDDKYIIIVRLISRYMDYIIDKNSCKYKRGNNQSRVEKENILIFEKKRSAKQQGIVRYCSNCGHPMDVNRTGYCEYCHTTYNQQDYDWILTSIETKNI